MVPKQTNKQKTTKMPHCSHLKDTRKSTHDSEYWLKKEEESQALIILYKLYLKVIR
jgi:hypothetical protein